MKPIVDETLTLTFTGEITLKRETLVSLLRDAMPSVSSPMESKPLRLAFSMRETAELIGCSYITVHRLVQRGLLRSSNACRHKMIAKSEIERFLKETSASDW